MSDDWIIKPTDFKLAESDIFGFTHAKIYGPELRKCVVYFATLIVTLEFKFRLDRFIMGNTESDAVPPIRSQYPDQEIR
jgi:hypothetical protein